MAVCLIAGGLVESAWATQAAPATAKQYDAAKIGSIVGNVKSGIEVLTGRMKNLLTKVQALKADLASAKTTGGTVEAVKNAFESAVGKDEKGGLLFDLKQALWGDISVGGKLTKGLVFVIQQLESEFPDLKVEDAQKTWGESTERGKKGEARKTAEATKAAVSLQPTVSGTPLSVSPSVSPAEAPATGQ